jgi:hypothetical protein
MKQTNILSFVFAFLLVLSFASALPSSNSYSFISPLNDSIITDNSFTLINLSVIGYNDVSFVEDGSSSLLSNDGDAYWYYDDWIVQNGENVVPLMFINDSSGEYEYANLTFYNLPISFVSPNSLVNSLFVDINISAPGYIGVFYFDDTSLYGDDEYWYDVNYEAVEGENNLTLKFCVDGDTCTTRILSFTVDTIKPVITLIGGNETLTVGDVYTDKGATADDGVSGNLTSNITNISNVNTSAVGTYYVQYSVVDNAGNSASLNRTVIVNAAPVTGGNGGGSSSCTTVWTCTDWSECNGGVQSRTCSYPANYCEPEASEPMDLRSCSVPVLNDNQDNQTLVEENATNSTATNFISAITGAVIGTTAGRWSLGVVIFLILLGVAWWIVAAKKKRAQSNKKKK